MTDYTALQRYWATLPQPSAGDAASIAANLSIVNDRTIEGPKVDVPVGEVIGYLALNVRLVQLQGYAQNPPAGANPQAVVVAKELLTLLSTPGLTTFRTSDTMTLAGIKNLLEALVVDTANNGITAADVDALLALADGPTLIWYNAPVAQGGAGLPGALVNAWDLFNAGLISEADAHAVEAA